MLKLSWSKHHDLSTFGKAYFTAEYTCPYIWTAKTHLLVLLQIGMQLRPRRPEVCTVLIEPIGLANMLRQLPSSPHP